MPRRATESVAELLNETLLGEGWQHAEEAVVIFDDDCNYLAFNDAYCRLIGYEREEVENLRVGGKLVANQPSHDLFADILASGSPRVGRAAVRQKDGSAVGVCYRMIRTTVSSLPYVIAIVWPDEQAHAGPATAPPTPA